VTSNVVPPSNPSPRPAARPLAFHAWLRETAGRRGLSGGTLARHVGRPANHVYGWFLGVYLPDEDDLPALAEALGVTIGEVRRALARPSAPDASGAAAPLPRSSPDPGARRSAPPPRRW